MGLALVSSGEVDVVSSSGAYEDGWCESSFTCRIRALRDLRTCQIGIWLKPELNRTRGNFAVAVNGREAIQCSVPFDMATVVQIACNARAGEIATLEFLCDNLVVEKGSDLRALSFLMTSLDFS